MHRNLKRNIVVAAVLVFVGAAVWLNWSYNNRWGKADAAMAAAEDAAMLQAEEEYLAASATGKGTLSTAYFDDARLARQSARDEALSLLEMACDEETVSQDVIDESMRQINAMASWNLQESVLENELLAKEFTDCVVFVSDDGVTVAVPAPGDASFGACLLAGTGIGLFADVKDAVRKCLRVDRTLAPDPSVAARYDRLYAVYRQIHDALAPIRF